MNHLRGIEDPIHSILLAGKVLAAGSQHEIDQLHLAGVLAIA